MAHNLSEATERLLASYRRYYNITLYDNDKLPLRALCEYYEHNEKYFVSRKANLWTANSEEFIFLHEIPVLTLEVFKNCLGEARDAGRKLANIGSGHMCTYITPVFVCESCEADALKALKKCRIRKAFLFSLHGWLEVRLAAYLASEGTVITNSAGKCMKKSLEKILL